MTIMEQDALARERITKEIESNFFVEAAAGSGKTSSLVDRMIAMVAATAKTITTAMEDTTIFSFLDISLILVTKLIRPLLSFSTTVQLSNINCPLSSNQLCCRMHPGRRMWSWHHYR